MAWKRVRRGEGNNDIFWTLSGRMVLASSVSPLWRASLAWVEEKGGSPGPKSTLGHAPCTVSTVAPMAARRAAESASSAFGERSGM